MCSILLSMKSVGRAYGSGTQVLDPTWRVPSSATVNSTRRGDGKHGRLSSASNDSAEVFMFDSRPGRIRLGSHLSEATLQLGKSGSRGRTLDDSGLPGFIHVVLHGFKGAFLSVRRSRDARGGIVEGFHVEQDVGGRAAGGRGGGGARGRGEVVGCYLGEETLRLSQRAVHQVSVLFSCEGKNIKNRLYNIVI